MSDTPPLRFRPHHFLCALGFQGKGYSDDFTANMRAIVMGRLRTPEGRETRIKLTGYADDICAPCPKRQGRLCTNQQSISQLDRSHAAALKLQPHEELTWGEALQRIKQNVPPGALSTVCSGCQWLEYGLCEDALKRLHDSDEG
ncbi:hypothetical protein TRP8649_02098 [Pelagimonas phthalicica]|uniref:DUF1284 domain-containing protein n=1 Tax=Pelagimonas phthalicica TaxID=1037362 RepID=A0A238JDR2_9RHOB|nr:DUF1284 domain-containing protein [Pelagimonas phthalicica]TDS90939.1 hypothetical protein CLV87_2100 [Pelagimonas phthalicica]SMX27986.1 hypothetical protein TRP8649_02098 [Pelagimonas phthalicica]